MEFGLQYKKTTCFLLSIKTNFKISNLNLLSFSFFKSNQIKSTKIHLKKWLIPLPLQVPAVASTIYSSTSWPVVSPAPSPRLSQLPSRESSSCFRPRKPTRDLMVANTPESLIVSIDASQKRVLSLCGVVTGLMSSDISPLKP